MIEDFTNPHGGLKPIKVYEIKTLEPPKLRVVFEQGCHRVEQQSQHVELVGKETVLRQKWNQCHDIATGKPAIYQTIGEAESFVKRCLTPSKIYYY